MGLGVFTMPLHLGRTQGTMPQMLRATLKRKEDRRDEVKGFNDRPLPEKDHHKIEPIRFHLMMKYVPEDVKSEHIILPHKTQHKDAVSGARGIVVAFGEFAQGASHLDGQVKIGTEVVVDESISVDDGNRCFKDGEDVYVLVDVASVIATVVDGNLVPLLDRIVAVKNEEKEVQRASGIYVVEKNGQAYGGIVSAVGPGRKGKSGRLPMAVAEGDRIMWPKHDNGTDVFLNQKHFIVMKQDKVLAVEHA